MPDPNYVFAKFDNIDPLVLLHLHRVGSANKYDMPSIWPAVPFFEHQYRYKECATDNQVFYMAQITDPPMSLQEAAALGDVKVLKLILSQGIDVDHREDGFRKTPLHRAAINGHKQVVELLLAEGADPDARDTWPGLTPVHYATQNGHKEIVELLIAKGADVNAKTSQGQTPLDIALGRNHREIVELLAKVAGIPSIHVAALVGNIDKVKESLEQGTNVNAKDENGMTPLLRAISGKHSEVARFLIDAGADVNTADKQGYVPLVYALWISDPNMVKLLLDKGADVNVSDTEMGFSVLHWSILMGNKEATELVLTSGADVNVKSNSGETPLDVAAYSASSAIGGLLMAHGAQISSLSAAAYVGDLAKVQAFIADGADINSKAGMVQNTALHSAVAGGRTEVAEFLVSKGSDVNAQNRAGQTPLHMAAGAGHLEVVQLLLKNGADANAKDSRGQTALDLAQKAEHNAIVELLQKQMEVHNVSITEVSAPTSCVQGETVSIVVTLDNQGDAGESCDAMLVDVADDMEIGRQSVTIDSRNLTASEADLTITGEVKDETEFGNWCNAEGDVNGDGFIDLLITAHHYPSMSVSRGRAYLYYGGPQMDNTPDMRFTGEEDGDTLGGYAGFLVDMNNDGFADVVLGARHHNSRGRVYVFFGGEDMDEEPDVVIDPPSGDGTDLSFGRGGMHPGDFNGDGHMDLACRAGGYANRTGRVYLYFGPLASDTKVDLVLTGENAGDLFGAIMGVGDVNGDNCDDLLAATRNFPGGANRGRAYFYYGANGASMDTGHDVIFDPPHGGIDQYGSSADLFDIDNDGFAEVIVGARACSSYRGRVYLYWGKSGGFDDSVGLTFTGEVVNSALGGDFINCGYADDDPYADILVTAYAYNHEQSRAYLYCGSTQVDMDAVADHIFTPEPGRNGVFRSALADLNGDGHADVMMAGAYYNKGQGRAWLWYGPFSTSTDITIHWDTTNASPGKHTLKVEIPPAAGEQNTEDNIKTVIIEVKEPK